MVGNLETISARAVIRSRRVCALIVTIAIICLTFVDVDAIAGGRVLGIPIEAAALERAHSVRTLLRTVAIVGHAFVRILARFAVVERLEARITFAAIRFGAADLLASAVVRLTDAGPLTLLPIVGQLEAVVASANHLAANHTTHVRAIAVVALARVDGVRILDGQRNARPPIHVQVHVVRALALITVRRVDAIVRALRMARIDIVQMAAKVTFTRSLIVVQVVLGRTLAHERSDRVDAFVRANRLDRRLVVLIVELGEDGALVDVTARFAIVVNLESGRTSALVRSERILAVFAAGVPFLALVNVDAAAGLVQSQAIAARFQRSIRMLLFGRYIVLALGQQLSVLVILQAPI